MREEGYYWVKTKEYDRWDIGFWDIENLAFFVNQDAYDYRESEMDSIIEIKIDRLDMLHMGNVILAIEELVPKNNMIHNSGSYNKLKGKFIDA